jgi:ABC-type multidrug transport system fused ATPase/permease subunit
MWKTIKTFYHFVFRKKLVYILVIVTVVITSALQSITPYFFKLFVDAIPALNYQNLMNILFIYIGISVLSLTIDVISGWFGDVVLLDAARDAREEIFKHVQSLDFSFHSNKSTGSLISAFKRGDGAFFDMFQTFHFNFLNVFVTTLVMVYFFTKINAPIAITMVISLVVALIAIRLLIKNNVKKRNIHNDREDNVSAIITDNMMNYETVKLFAREKWEEKRLSDAFIDWTKTLWGYANSFRLIDIVVGGITSVSIFLTFFLALYFTVNLKLSVGDFVMVVGFVGIFFPKIWNLVYGTRSIAKNYADIEKYFGLLDEKVEVLDPEKPVKIDHVFGEINFDKVYFTYNGRTKNAINGIDLKINQGESVALVGRSGSGKTTMAKLLMRFFDLSSGHITIDGIDIKNFTKSDLRSFVGVVPQEPILFNNTIAYNIGYGKDNPKMSDVKTAAKLANIDEFIEGLKKKYDTEVGERGVKLSGGQKQRIAIARMILSDPDIVVFDEATSNLDSESEKLIQDAFWKARAGKTTIIIAHRLSTVMRADKIIVMEEGKIKEIGTHGSLLKDENSLYSHFWNLQIKLD